MSAETGTSRPLHPPDRISKSHPKRYLVLGSIGHFGFSSCTWKQAATVTIPDYDVIIVDMPSLAAESQRTRLTFQEVNSIRDGLLRVLASSGQVIIIADVAQNIKVYIGSDSPRETTIPNYFIIPVVINVHNESGESINLFPASRYFRYLSTIRTWRFHFDVRPTLSAPELQQTLGANAFMFNQTEIFMTNREGKILAAEYRLTKPLEALMALFSQPTRAAVPQNPQTNISTLTVLPCGPASKANDTIAEIIAELTAKTVDVPAPEWVSGIEIPGVNELDNAISLKEAEIGNLSSEVEDLTQKRNRLLDFRKLLYSEGRE